MPLPLSSCLLRRLPVVVLGFVLNLALAACGSDKSAPPPAEPGPLKSGMFADHPVEGLEFSSGSAPVSLTDRQGTFSYRDGTPVSFAIGGIALGSEVAGAVTVTPLQLAPGAAGATDPRVTNMARLLQTLDADCDVSNGIRLTPAARGAGSGRSIDFDQTEAAFGSDSAVQNFLEAAAAGCRDTAAPDNGLVSGALARQRLGETLAHMETNGGRANRLPVALAGADFQVNEGAVASLAGAGADDDGTVPDSGYRWTQLSGPAVISGPVLTASFNFAAPAVEADTPVTLRLRVTDDDDGTHDDDLTITIRNGTVNDRPIADAGADQTVNETETVTLNGANSRDPEDGVNISYQWTQDPDDPVAVTLSGADGPTPTFTAPVVAAQIRLHFTLIVRDSQNLASAPDTVTITVNNVVGVAPVADAGPDRMVDEGAAVTLDGTDSTDSTDPDGSITGFDWTQTAGAPVMLTGANTATPSFAAPDVVGDEDLTFRLTVTDNHGDTDNDSVTVRVLDRRVISIGSPAPVIEGDVGLTEVSFTVRLTLPAVNPVTVEYTTQDVTATAGLDYEAASDTLEFQAGEDEKTVTVNVIGDVFDENDETFQLILSGITGAGAGNTTGTGTIVDNDADLLRVGAAKSVVTPTLPHIAGMPEERLGGQEVKQLFHLGGFGFGPFEPSRFGEAHFAGFTDATSCAPGQIPEIGGECLTNPPAKRAYHCKGFTADCPEAEGEHTFVRALYLAQTSGEEVLFITLDAIGAGNVIQDNLKGKVSQATGVAPDNILFGQTHSHAGADLQGLWGGVPQDWVLRLYTEAAVAAKAAKDSAQPARLTYGKGRDGAFNKYRRPQYDVNAAPDETVSVLQARDQQDRIIGTLVQYAAHPTSIGTDSGCLNADDDDRKCELEDQPQLERAVHADYVLGVEDSIEATSGGAPAIFYNGPIADAAPSGPGARATRTGDDYDAVHARGECLARSVLVILGSAGATKCSGSELDPASVRRVPLGATLSVRHETATLPVTNPLFAAAGAIGAFNRYYNFTEMLLSDVPVVGEALAALAGQEPNLPQVTPVARTVVSRVTVGADSVGRKGLEIVTIPGEATNTFGQYIRGLARTEAGTDDVVLLGLTHNSFGYILPEEEFNFIDESGDAGFVLPFTGYEEFVSLGPLTAPLLRFQAYNPLFGIADDDDPRNLPPTLLSCQEDRAGRACLVSQLIAHLDYVQRAYAEACRDNFVRNPGQEFPDPFGSELESAGEQYRLAAEQFCAMLDPQLPGAQECHDNEFLPASLCDILGTGQIPTENADAELMEDVARSHAAGCDILDPHYCLFPFPNDYFTLADGDTDTGRRVNFNVAAMPRNFAGKPIDPTEWNRNDGFSPGQPIMLRVPDLDLASSGAVPITDIGQYDDLDAPIVVLDTGTADAPLLVPVRHPIWVELDANTTGFNPCNTPEDVHGLLAEIADIAGFGGEYDDNVPPPPEEFREGCSSTDPAPSAIANAPGNDPGPALIIRPARNFLDGHRYVVVLRNLKNAENNPIDPGTAFKVCTGQEFSSLTLVRNRCDQLRQTVFPVLKNAGIVASTQPADLAASGLYLAWDFTVASTRNLAERMLHMRDDAFGDLGTGVPTYTVDNVLNNVDGNTRRRVQGTITVPSYLIFPDGPCDNPGPDSGQPSQLRNYCETLADGFAEGEDSGVPGVSDFFGGAGDVLAVAREFIGMPMSRLYFEPNEKGRYGDGRPDRNPMLQEITVNYTCNIPHSAFAKPGQARPTLYGHGLLGGQGEANGGSVMPFANAHNFMVCATDWIGMASRDVPTVAAILVDMSNFPSLADRAQQGMLNFLFLGRLMKHAGGFAADPNFQVGGQSLFNNSDVFYDGNSQGGIMGGALMSVAQDIKRGVLGVPGMNYSTLLQRSVDFDLYGSVFYAAYPNPVDQLFTIGLIQMLWDRAEANGYANHMTKGDYDFVNTADPKPTPEKQVLMHVAFGDHQVADVSAEVEARTIGANLYTPTVNVRGAVESTRIRSDLLEQPFFGLAPAVGNDPAESAMVIWDIGPLGNRYNEGTIIPPEDNLPPRAEGSRDPHGDPRRDVKGWQQKSDFLKPAGTFNNYCFARDGVTPRACFTRKYKKAVARAFASPSPAALDSTVSLNATGSATEAENDGLATSYKWEQVGGPVVALTNASTAVATFTMPALACNKALVFVVTVTDVVFSDRAQVSVTRDGDDCDPPDYGGGVIGALAQLMAELHDALTLLLGGDLPRGFAAMRFALSNFVDNLSAIPEESGTPGEIAGTDEEPADVITRARTADRSVEPVVLTGAQIPNWSVPAAIGSPYPYPSGAGLSNQCSDDFGAQGKAFCEQFFAGLALARDPLGLGEAQDAHNGLMLYPPPDPSDIPPVRELEEQFEEEAPGLPASVPMGVDVARVAAYRFVGIGADRADDNGFVEIPVQVDQRYPYFLANARSDFSFYSGTDEELTYEWDLERWGNPTTDPCRAAYTSATPDPIEGLDYDDEVVFMAGDAGQRADFGKIPADAEFDASVGLQEVALADPLDHDAPARFVYLGLKKAPFVGQYYGRQYYVNYARNTNADQWIDKDFFQAGDAEKLGTGNRGYGPNRAGTVCPNDTPDNPNGTPDNAQASSDRFPRDGVTVTTDRYRWRASGRWMVRDIRIAPQLDADNDGSNDRYDWSVPANVDARRDLVDRWKGRAFQQNPDSYINVIGGFEDEQVNWEANSNLLGERCGPVRCMREVWGADSGTNVTKTETFYRDAVTYRYHVRVHPIPPDGLYTAWDYNRSAMVPDADEGVPGGRFFTALRPQGVPIDGINDDIGNVDGVAPFPGSICVNFGRIDNALEDQDPDQALADPQNGVCPMFFDSADPTFNLLLAFDNWEQVSGKGNSGSLVYIFEIKGASSLFTPAVVPYYRDDSCFDDGTGDDPVARPFPGDAGSDTDVRNGYVAAARDRCLEEGGSAAACSAITYESLACEQKQGAYGSHGVHYFFTGDIDNAFLVGKPINEIDGQQWQFMVPTDAPRNVAEPYANIVRAPLRAVVTTRPGSNPADPAASPDFADLCESYGVAEADDLCGLLRTAEVQLRSGCDQNTGSATFCSLAGGNLHALIDTCYSQNPGDQIPACRIADAFVGAAAAYCRQVSTLSGNTQRPELCALIGGVLVSEGALQAYEASWTHKALLLQNKLGYGRPLIHNTLIATHNSFNATDDNTPPTLSGSDYNQLYDIVGQLRMDVRAIEIDVHWAPGRDGTPETFFREPMVCHGATDGGVPHIGCTHERPLREVLTELRTWLDAYPDEAILLYIEDGLDTPLDQQPDPALAHDTTAAVIEEVLGRNSLGGDLLFRPSDGSGCGNNEWLTVPRRTVIETGKQVIAYSDHNPDLPCVGAPWDALFFQKTNNNIKQGTQSSYRGFTYRTPPATDSCVLPDDAGFVGDSRRVKWTRVWEDSTLVTDVIGGPPAFITPDVAHQLMRCGLNMPSLDRLYPADGRLEGMVWSWAQNEPAADSAKNCAAHNSNGRFVAALCSQLRAFACVSNANPDQWKVTTGTGTWHSGLPPVSGSDTSPCATEHPGYHFGVPANGFANEKLKDAKVAAGVTEAWLNYSDEAEEGAWEGDAVGGMALRASAAFRTEVGLLGAIAGFLSDMGTAATVLLSGAFEDFANVVADALRSLAANLLGVLIGNETSSVSGAIERLLGNIRQLDADSLARDFARDLVEVLQGDTRTVAVRAGVGVVDMTPDVGYCSGQYCADFENAALFDVFEQGETDPYVTAKTKQKSDGVQSRLTARAIVVEGTNGKRIALLKTDNYLAQDNLMRRVGQILAKHGSTIRYEQILHHVTHNHTAAYSSTLSWGPWLFEDVYDARFFENQARKMAEAILIAEADLKPARMGATTVRHTIYKGNVVPPTSADDGTPAGHPLEYGDHGLVVMRFDDVSNPNDPQPLAVWINWGEHPESLDGHNMHSADFLAGLERFVEQETGVPLVFSQGDVGSAERSGNQNQMLTDAGAVCGDWHHIDDDNKKPGEPAPRADTCPFGQGVIRDWDHEGFVQTERNARYLADAIVKGWKVIAGDLPVDTPASNPSRINYVASVQVPLSSEFIVDHRHAWVPGPLSHPYPAVSNCRSQPTVEGDPNVPLIGGPPDCERASSLPQDENENGSSRDEYEAMISPFKPGFEALAMVVNSLKVHGIPVPDHYDVYSHVGLEENNRLYLQAFRLGEVLLASCACEAQADLILNLESRTDTDTDPGNIYDGLDWACIAEDKALIAAEADFADACDRQRDIYDVAEFDTPVPGSSIFTTPSSENQALIAHMRAQVHNKADGWDAPDYMLQANSEPLPPEDDPLDFTAIKGNFTEEEIQDISGASGYALPVGVGHAGDYNGYTISYREFMNRDHYRKSLTSYGSHTADYMVTRLVRLAAAMKGGPELEPEPHDTFAQADEARQVALSQLHGQVTSSAFDAFHGALLPDLAPVIVDQPEDITRFEAATFTWRGGSTAVDNPFAKVQREIAPGVWMDAYDMTGEVQTRIHWPQGIPDTLPAYAGRFEWLWTANFEAYSAFPARLGSTLAGTYRFVVDGRVKQGTEFAGYSLPSDPFTVSAWNGITVENVSTGLGTVSFTVPPISYPRSYEGAADAFPYIQDDNDPRICETCTFRPWARQGRVDRAEVVVDRGIAGTETVVATCTTSSSTASCSAGVVLLPGNTAEVRVYDQDDNFGTAAVP